VVRAVTGSLGVGLGVVIAASMGQMFFPASAFLTGITLYGGLVRVACCVLRVKHF
jgi:hypothetical protein